MGRPSTFSSFLATGTPSWTVVEPCRITLGVCGKIRAYNDHISFGMMTPALRFFEDWYYRQELRKQIETRGAEEMGLLPLDFRFACFGTNDLVCGLVTPSQDGRGRDDYPLVLVVHVHRGGIQRFNSEFIETLLSPLAGLAEELKAMQAPGGLEKSIARVEREMRENADQLTEGQTGARELVSGAEDDGELDPFPRILWSLDSQLPTDTIFERRLFPPNELPEAHVRLPTVADGVSERFAIWAFFFYAAIQGNLPLYLFSLEGFDWLDLYAGDPSSELIFRSRLSDDVFPPASNIPYNVAPEFLERTLDFARDLRRRTTVGTRFPKTFLEWLRVR